MERADLSPDERQELSLPDRLLTIVESIANSDQPMGVMAIAAATGIDKSAVSRLLKTLASRRWVEKGPEGYVAGAALIQLASKAGVDDIIGRLASRELNVLLQATDETVSFHRVVGSQRICILGLESPQIMRGRIPLGETIPLTHGTSGKVILAWVDEALRARLLAELAPEVRENVTRQLVFIEANGYLSTEHDPNQGVGALAVPVFGPYGIVGSLGAIGPAERWNADQRRKHARVGLKCAARMAAELGYVGDRYERWATTALDQTLVEA
ncbi:helix-turn-helix domain-containing protein [Dactylosporangium roseum]|uniref:Helix-turn-helix domain-containing protein n=1 Tax=Dactylosporangium roseum TaxID=47989 RepID=A0ABY5ZC85_9ACTN|nr:helix-turn-helix domain-containing protein [Dactylosporangium roseum]UWZ39181.1 helix-turn-helix domain-containing protein [Dactylosporangium roseum]